MNLALVTRLPTLHLAASIAVCWLAASEARSEPGRDQTDSMQRRELKAAPVFPPVEILPSSYQLARQITIRTSTSRVFIGSLRNGKLDFVEQTNPGLQTQALGALDVNGDYSADLLFRDDVDVGDFGVVKVWDKFSKPSEKIVRSVNRAWKVEAVGDMDGDGFEDLVWRYTKVGTSDTGVSYVWFMNGSRVTQVRKRGGAPLNWRLLGALDVNFDGASDLLYLSPVPTNGEQRQVRVLMATQNRTCANYGFTGFTSSDSEILGIGRFPYPGVLYKGAANTVDLLAIDMVGQALAPPVGNPDDPNASCTSVGSGSVRFGTQYQLGFVDPGWSFFAAVNLDEDGATDIIWRKPDGRLAIWLVSQSGGLKARIDDAGLLPD